MRSGFFPSEVVKHVTISHEALINAARSGDSATIDFLIEAKNSGCDLDLNNTKRLTGQMDYSEKHNQELEIYCKESALGVLLSQRDFENASKLIQAGAELFHTTEMWDNDDRFGGYIRSRKSFLEIFSRDEEV